MQAANARPQGRGARLPRRPVRCTCKAGVDEGGKRYLQLLGQGLPSFIVHPPCVQSRLFDCRAVTREQPRWLGVAPIAEHLDETDYECWVCEWRRHGSNSTCSVRPSVLDQSCVRPPRQKAEKASPAA